MPNSNHHIKPLTSIRFFAAFFVMLSHLEFLRNTNLSFLSIDEGYASVTLFFILSGFVLSYSYQNRLLNKETLISKFYVARIARVYPIHIITFLITILLLPIANNSFRYYFYNITLIQAYIPSDKYYFDFNAVSWSLSVEMFFYLLFPFLIKFRNRYLVLITLFLLTIKIINPFEAIGKTHAFLYIFPLFRLPDFIIGILLYRIRKKYTFASIPSLTSLYQIVSVMILIIFMLLLKKVNISYRYDIYHIIPMALIIYSFSFSNGILGKCLSNKFLVILGESSFSLYMIHQLVIRYMINRVGLENLNWKLPVSMILISIVLSLFMFKYLETPLKNIIMDVFNRLFFKKYRE